MSVRRVIGVTAGVVGGTVVVAGVGLAGLILWAGEDEDLLAVRKWTEEWWEKYGYDSALRAYRRKDTEISVNRHQNAAYAALKRYVLRLYIVLRMEDLAFAVPNPTGRVWMSLKAMEYGRALSTLEAELRCEYGIVIGSLPADFEREFFPNLHDLS